MDGIYCMGRADIFPAAWGIWMSSSHSPNNSNSNATTAGSINLSYSGKTPHENEKIWISFHTNPFAELTSEKHSLIHLLIHSALNCLWVRQFLLLQLNICLLMLSPGLPLTSLPSSVGTTFTSSPYVPWHDLFLHLNNTAVLQCHHTCTQWQDSTGHAQSWELWDSKSAL